MIVLDGPPLARRGGGLDADDARPWRGRRSCSPPSPRTAMGRSAEFDEDGWWRSRRCGAPCAAWRATTTAPEGVKKHVKM